MDEMHSYRVKLVYLAVSKYEKQTAEQVRDILMCCVIQHMVMLPIPLEKHRCQFYRWFKSHSCRVYQTVFHSCHFNLS